MFAVSTASDDMSLRRKKSSVDIPDGTPSKKKSKTDTVPNAGHEPIVQRRDTLIIESSPPKLSAAAKLQRSVSPKLIWCETKAKETFISTTGDTPDRKTNTPVIRILENTKCKDNGTKHVDDCDQSIEEIKEDEVVGNTRSVQLRMATPNISSTEPVMLNVATAPMSPNSSIASSITRKSPNSYIASSITKKVQPPSTNMNYFVNREPDDCQSIGNFSCLREYAEDDTVQFTEDNDRTEKTDNENQQVIKQQPIIKSQQQTTARPLGCTINEKSNAIFQAGAESITASIETILQTVNQGSQQVKKIIKGKGKNKRNVKPDYFNNDPSTMPIEDATLKEEVSQPVVATDRRTTKTPLTPVLASAPDLIFKSPPGRRDAFLDNISPSSMSTQSEACSIMSRDVYKVLKEKMLSQTLSQYSGSHKNVDTIDENRIETRNLPGSVHAPPRMEDENPLSSVSNKESLKSKAPYKSAPKSYVAGAVNENPLSSLSNKELLKPKAPNKPTPKFYVAGAAKNASHVSSMPPSTYKTLIYTTPSQMFGPQSMLSLFRPPAVNTVGNGNIITQGTTPSRTSASQSSSSLLRPPAVHTVGNGNIFTQKTDVAGMNLEGDTMNSDDVEKVIKRRVVLCIVSFLPKIKNVNLILLYWGLTSL